MAIRVALQHRTTYRFDRPVNALAARDPPAPGAALPDADPRLFVQRRAGQAFPELAAGPLRQLARAAGVHRAGRPPRHRRRPHRRHDGDQSVRFLRRGLRRAFSVHLCAGAGEGADSVPRDRAARAAPRRLARPVSRARRKAGEKTVDMLVRLNQQLQGEIAYLVRMEPGVQTPEETLRARARLVPRHRLAAGADPAPAGTRRALRLGLPDPARRRREAARRPGRPGEGFHRPARLGRGLPARRRLGRPRSDVGAARRRGPHSARLHGGSGQRGAGDRLHRRLRSRIRRRDERDPRARGPARHQAVHRRAVGGDRGAWPAASIATSCSHDVRLTQGGEPTFVSIDDMDGAGVELHGAVAEEARARRGAAAPACARASRRAACCTTGRASGIPANRCRAGRSASTGGSTASRCGAIRR